MKSYEITYLTSGEETPDAKLIAPMLAEHEAKISSVHPWGSRRRLVFPIKKQDQAFYTTVVFEADPSKIAPIQHDIHLSSDILRALIVEFEPGIFHRSVPTANESSMVKSPSTEKSLEAAGQETAPEISVSAVSTTENQVAPVEVSKENKPKRVRSTKKASSSDDKTLDEKLDKLLNEDITK